MQRPPHRDGGVAHMSIQSTSRPSVVHFLAWFRVDRTSITSPLATLVILSSLLVSVVAASSVGTPPGNDAPGSPLLASASSAEPKVGDCYFYPDDWPSFPPDGDRRHGRSLYPPVACEAFHVAETFHVTRSQSDYPCWDATAEQAFNAYTMQMQSNRNLLPSLKIEDIRPSPEQQAMGADWVRCDIVFSLVNTSKRNYQWGGLLGWYGSLAQVAKRGASVGGGSWLAACLPRPPSSTKGRWDPSFPLPGNDPAWRPCAEFSPEGTPDRLTKDWVWLGQAWEPTSRTEGPLRQATRMCKAMVSDHVAKPTARGVEVRWEPGEDWITGRKLTLASCFVPYKSLQWRSGWIFPAPVRSGEVA